MLVETLKNSSLLLSIRVDVFKHVQLVTKVATDFGGMRSATTPYEIRLHQATAPRILCIKFLERNPCLIQGYCMTMKQSMG